MPSPASSTPVQRRHREAAVRKLLPNTGPLSWVWTIYVEQGDGTAPQLRDVVRAAQLAADAEAGLLLPPGLRPQQAEAAPTPVAGGGMTTSAFMPPKK